MADKVNTTQSIKQGEPPVDHNQAAGNYLKDLAEKQVAQPAFLPPAPASITVDEPTIEDVEASEMAGDENAGYPSEDVVDERAND